MRQSSRSWTPLLVALGFDLLAAGLAMYGGIEIRYWFEAQSAAPRPYPEGLAGLASGLFVASALVSHLLLRTHLQVWRYFARPDFVRLVQGAALAVVIFLPVLFIVNRLVGLPRSSLVLAPIAWLTLMVIARTLVRLWSRRSGLGQALPTIARAPEGYIVGETAAMARLFQSFRERGKTLPIVPLGLVSLDGDQVGRSIFGLPVLDGLGGLEAGLVRRKRNADQPVHVALVGEADRALISKVLEITSRMGCALMRVGEESGQLRSIDTSALLSRPVRSHETQAVTDMLRNATVLITGAGGSIGSELARQCSEKGAGHIVLYDNSEQNLFEIDRTLRDLTPEVRRTAVLGDICHADRLTDVLTTTKPDILFHAAALKHVPLMEANPDAAVLTNVQGTHLVFDAARRAGVRLGVLVSTDKAVAPTSVMGWTKRLAERVVADAGRDKGFATATVRFGNALGSSGSVVPIFEEQIARGGPVTVTDPDMTRYFMSIDEAAGLVLQAAALTTDADAPALYVLDMGEPIRIGDLAELMIRLQGYLPHRNIEIRTIGKRPGEKVDEALVEPDDQLIPTAFPGIEQVRFATGPVPLDEAALQALFEAAAAGRIDEVRTRLTSLGSHSG